MKKIIKKGRTYTREEMSDNFAVCVCILILLVMGIMLLL